VNDTVELSWPSSAAGWMLQSAPTLTADPSPWTIVPGDPVKVGENNIVTETLSPPRKFYRLAKPQGP
jgi:hypothetical protein